MADLVPEVGIRSDISHFVDGIDSVLSDCEIILSILERNFFVERMLINSELEIGRSRMTVARLYVA